MLKRNSIFVKVLIPVVIVMLLQVLLISMVLFVNGTISSLKDNAIESMRKNVENRSISLEDMMVFFWTGIDNLEINISAEIDMYTDEHNISISDVLGSYEHETSILSNISDSLLGTLRQTLSTGVYMYFLDSESYTGRAVTCNGIYYRDLDPISTPADYSDILYVRGFIDIARKDHIQLDSLWSEAFYFSPEYPDVWNNYSKPLKAALENPDISTVDLSYWDRPHFLNPDSQLDSNKCITYSRPVLYNGVPIAIIGTEIQISYLEDYFPANDFYNSNKKGYMLIKYERDNQDNTGINCDIFAVTGSYIKRMVGSDGSVTLIPTNREGVYTIDLKADETVRVVTRSLRIYNTNAPFSGDQWALAAIGADSELFESAQKVSSGILYSSALALLIGIIVIAFIIRLSTRPIISIANQIENSGLDDPVVVPKTDTYEIVLLCSTINGMRDRRRKAEAQLREERERYLIALESTEDTFMEYDIVNDTFMLYFFSGENQLRSKVLTQFMDKVYSGGICHPDDIEKLIMLISSEIEEPFEVRAKASLFSHIDEAETDEGYYWFLLKASSINGADGSVIKRIGTAREITREKLLEYARIETARRDPTTGLYNRDYGMPLLKNQVRSSLKDAVPFAICVIRADNFDMFEAYYGRVFGGVILMMLSRKLLLAITNRNLAIRLSNDEFLLLLHGDGNEIKSRIEYIYNDISNIYVGENPDLKMNVRIGVSVSSDAAECNEMIRNAYRAMEFAVKNADEGVIYDKDLPTEIKNTKAIKYGKPESVNLDISKESVVGIAFELFERTTDVHSAVNLLLSVLGEMFFLRQIIIYSCDLDFGTRHILYQWNKKGSFLFHSGIEKVSSEDLVEFERLRDEDDVVIYDGKTLGKCGEGAKKLLCVMPGEQINAYCSVMYENGFHVGRIIFKSEEWDRQWTDSERFSLYEITKIITAHLSIEKSNSASRAKSEFLSRISHEIRTPMNAIIGMTDIAKSSTSDIIQLESCLNKIDFSAKHLLSIINDVLEMSRIESGKLEIENRPFSLANLEYGIDILMRPAIEGKDISFTINSNYRHAVVLGDEYRLRQVLVNLIGNAGKFTDPGGMVEISIEELEDYMPEGQDSEGANADRDIEAEDKKYGYFRFSVKDTGIGISPEDQPLIFKAFEQAKTSPYSQKRQGTGLGLAISGNIIAAMGGRIELISKVGEGSEFYFILRFELSMDSNSDTNSESGQTDYKDIFKGKRILLAEDNEINIEIALYALEWAGLKVDVAKDGSETVEKFFASEPDYYDAILMDIQMPVMNGLTATRSIRKNMERPDSRSVPIIAMTANAFDEDMKRSIESGMNGHIAKPINNEELYKLLGQLI